MNWYSTFYWVTRADSIKTFFDVTSNIFTFLSIMLFFAHLVFAIWQKAVISEEKLETEEQERSNPQWRSITKAKGYVGGLFYTFLAISLVTWAGYMFTPTKKETLLIIAGGGTMNFLITDSSAKKIPHELTSFVITELKSMAADAKVDLGISTQKDKILEEAKEMTGLQLIEKMKSDSVFAKIIVDKN